jgi:hypothetical protein
LHSFKTIELPGSISSIVGKAFAYCLSLKKIVIPSRVDVIFQEAFKGCLNLPIYCQVFSQTFSWDSAWNSDGCPVVWGNPG